MRVLIRCACSASSDNAERPDECSESLVIPRARVRLVGFALGACESSFAQGNHASELASTRRSLLEPNSLPRARCTLSYLFAVLKPHVFIGLVSLGRAGRVHLGLVSSGAGVPVKSDVVMKSCRSVP